MMIDAEFSLGGQPNGPRRSPGSPLRVLLIVDCYGNGRDSRHDNRFGDTASGRPLGERPMSRIDIDNFDRVLARLAPTLDMGEHGCLEFQALEDFHPDRLCQRSAVLARLQDVHRALGDPEQARRLLEGSQQGQADTPSTTDLPGSDLERLLGGKVEAAGRLGHDGAIDSRFSQYLASLVAPHVVDVSAAEPHRQATAATLTEQLHDLLHQPDFQQLESCWRGLWWLVSQLPAEQIEFRLLPLSRAELQADLDQAGTNLASSQLFKQIFRSSDACNWSVLSVFQAFDSKHEDIRMLAALSALAAGGGAALLAEAGPGLVGCPGAAGLADPAGWQPLEDAVAERWQALRNSQAAASVALGLPRLLLRAPYGKRHDPIDSFDFDEQVADRSQLLWGSGALGLTGALGLMFQDAEWDMDPSSAVQLDDLATFTYHSDGEPRLQPAAEVVLSDQAIEALARAGLTPFIASRNRIEVIMPGCVSLAGTRLHGPWD